MELRELSKMRRIAGYTQESLAAALNISWRTVQNWELKGEVPDNKVEGIYLVLKGELDKYSSDKAVGSFLDKIDPDYTVSDNDIKRVKEMKSEKLAISPEFSNHEGYSQKHNLQKALIDMGFMSENADLFTMIFSEVYYSAREKNSRGKAPFAKKLMLDEDHLEGLLSGRYKVTPGILVSCELWFTESYEKVIKWHGDEIVKRYITSRSAENFQKVIAVPVEYINRYCNEYSDTEFIKKLPIISIPGNPFTGINFRFFQLEGYSMEYFGAYSELTGIPAGSWLLAEKKAIIDASGDPVYAIVSGHRFIVGRVKIDIENNITIIPDNPEYSRALITFDKISEIWEVKKWMSMNSVRPKWDPLNPSPKIES